MVWENDEPVMVDTPSRDWACLAAPVWADCEEPRRELFNCERSNAEELAFRCSCADRETEVFSEDLVETVRTGAVDAACARIDSTSGGDEEQE